MKKYALIFAVFGFLSVALGAFAAHGLKSRLPEKYLAIFHTGVEYQFYHVLALGLVLMLSQSAATGALKLAALFFSLGIVIFSGSLYALALTEIGILGAVTPFGGLCFLAGWGCVFVHALKWPE